MKKLVCGIFGTIYYATILKDGLMSDINRVDVTQDAINAVMTHFWQSDQYIREGWAGCKANIGNKELSLRLYDTTKYKLVPIKEEVK